MRSIAHLAPESGPRAVSVQELHLARSGCAQRSLEAGPARAARPGAAARGGHLPRMRTSMVALVLGIALGAAPVRAQSSHWRSRWPRFQIAEGVLGLAALGVGLAIYFEGERLDPRWTAPLPLDRETRALLVSHSIAEREAVSRASDAMFISMMVYPVAIDALLVAGAIHRDADVMGQMLLVDAEALALGLLASMITTRLVGRERPFVIECARDPTYAAGCGGDGLGRNTSFVGGHALMSFLGAGLVCAHHVHHPWLYGGPAGGAVACTAGLGVASAISIMRIVADRHWLSDIVAGATLGAAIGWLVPLLHYTIGPRGSPSPAPAPRISALPAAPGADVGITIAGAL